jgi:cytochrome P450
MSPLTSPLTSAVGLEQPSRSRSGLRRTPRETVRWLLAHGIIRAFNTWQARKGSLVSRLMTDPELRADPYPTYEQIRAQGALVGEGPFRVTCSHEVASAVLRSDAFGEPAANTHFREPLHSIYLASKDDYDVGPLDPPSLLALDPPDHTRLRRLVARDFTARRVAQMTGAIEATTRDLLDELEQHQGEVDLVEHFAARLPVAVIADLLGVPAEDRGRLLEWGNEGAKQLDGGLGYREFRRTATAITEMHEWMDAHLHRLRLQPGDDLLSAVLQDVEAMDAEQRPSAAELRMLGLLVLGAGFETTVNLIGNAAVLLDRHPDQRQRCVADPDLWGNAVEEVLRFDAPVQLTGRTAVRSTSVAGADLPQGTTVMILLGAVNRDPEVFAGPQVFDVGRRGAEGHLSFSLGAHFCLGAQLARLETRIALRELYARFPGLRLHGEPVRRRTQVLRGYERIPVTLG